MKLSIFIIYGFLYTVISEKYSSVVSNQLLSKSSPETTMSTTVKNSYNSTNSIFEPEKIKKSFNTKQISPINCITTNTKWDDCNEHFKIRKYITHLQNKINTITCNLKKNKTARKNDGKIKKPQNFLQLLKSNASIKILRLISKIFLLCNAIFILFLRYDHIAFKV